MSTKTLDSGLTPETHSIDFVPENERYGNVKMLFTLWFGANLQVTSIACGAIAVALGLSLPWAIVAAVIGHLVGAIFMALHSAQGPILGVPQMIQSRAQFGFYGAIIPLILVILMYIGYFATTAVQGGAALSSLTSVPIDSSIVIVVVITTLLAIFGYRLIHVSEKWLSWLSGVTFFAVTVMLFVNNSFDGLWTFEGFDWAMFLLAVAIAATWQLTYAPYVADYSRYLPKNTSIKASFWWTYTGTVVASVWMFALGAAIVAIAPTAFDGGSVDFIVQQIPFGQPVVYLVIVAGVIGVNALNLYGSFMSSTTIISSIVTIKVGQAVRAGIIVAAAVVATSIAIAGRENFLGNFLNFILLLAYFLIPWTSINLADFYLIRKEKYNVADFFNPKGEYGGVDWRTMVAYFFGILVEIPFISSSFYTGPISLALGGTDISWILGIFAAGGMYILLMKVAPTRTSQRRK
jgi:NCS1 family nucleobase:cation symporter-1